VSRSKAAGKTEQDSGQYEPFEAQERAGNATPIGSVLVVGDRSRLDV